jgi:serine/threonine protein kinase
MYWHALRFLSSVQISDTVLGAGGAGRVFKARYSGVQVAVKELYATMMNEEDLSELRHEAATLANLRHPNILQFFGVCSLGDKHLLVTEYARGGSLRSVVEDASVRKALDK